MKKLNFIVVIIVLFLVGCKKGNETYSIERKGYEYYHTFIINGNEFIIKQVDDRYYIADDLMISERQFNLIKKGEFSINTTPFFSSDDKRGSVRRGDETSFTYSWTNGRYYYKIESNRRDEILQAFAHIQENSNVVFIERTHENNYVTFKDAPASHNTSSSNHVGMEPGQSMEINLHSDQGLGTIIHETLHSLGFYHEHTRNDRNQFVDVNLNNIPHPPNSNEYKNIAYQYQIQSFSTSYGDFDFQSIMMYSSNNILTRANGGPGWQAQRVGLSAGDIEGLAQFYGSKITGATSICSQGTYTILHPGTVTLEDAVGIATLEHLGGNQYRVTRVGSAYGIVKLKATNASNITTTFSIGVGMLTNHMIDGPNHLFTNYYSLIEPVFSIRLASNENFTITQFITDRSQVELYDRNDGNLTFKLRIPFNWNFVASPTSDYFNFAVKGLNNGCVMFVEKQIQVYPDPNSGDDDDWQLPGN